MRIRYPQDLSPAFWNNREQPGITPDLLHSFEKAKLAYDGCGEVQLDPCDLVRFEDYRRVRHYLVHHLLPTLALAKKMAEQVGAVGDGALRHRLGLQAEALVKALEDMHGEFLLKLEEGEPKIEHVRRRLNKIIEVVAQFHHVFEVVLRNEQAHRFKEFLEMRDLYIKSIDELYSQGDGFFIDIVRKALGDHKVKWSQPFLELKAPSQAIDGAEIRKLMHGRRDGLHEVQILLDTLRHLRGMLAEVEAAGAT